MKSSTLINGLPAAEIPEVRQAMGPFIPATSRAVEEDDDIVDAEMVAETGLSRQCGRLNHEGCPEVDCECACHIAPGPDDEDDPILEP